MPAGRSISYGRKFVTARPSLIGVVPVGYGHGYSWLCSNRGAMLVGGKRAAVVGRVTMDLTMIDLAGAPDAQVGDEVVLFGEQAEAALPLEEVARGSETLPYEILCTIGKRVTRLYVQSGRPVKLTSLVGEREDWTRQAAEHFRRRAQAVAVAKGR
jgi:alanine racemase